MKIEYLKLKNFSAVKKAMNADEIVLHLDDCKNKICLLIGPNGSGKTTLLSLMSPFSDLGNLDTRNSQPLILKDKEGYKEIHITSNGNTYNIKHIYTPHKDKSHSVKSYIEKNGVELNVNGNVTSFKEIIKMELQIESEYLKLIRLGSNVTSLISLSETERKNFMSKIFDDIGVYLDYYKNVNNKYRQVKEMISHVVNKLEKLGVSDKILIEKEIADLQSRLDDLNNRRDKINEAMAVIRRDLETTPSDIPERHREYEKKLKKMNAILEKGDIVKESGYYDKMIVEKEEAIRNMELKYASQEATIHSNINIIDHYKDTIHMLEIEVGKEEESSKELKKLNDNLDSLRLSLRKSEEILGDFKPEYNPNKLEDFIVFLKNAQLLLDRTYEFGKKPVNKVIELMRESKDVNHYINSHLIRIDEKSNDVDSIFFAKIHNAFKFNDDFSDCKNKDCEARRLYNMVSTIFKDTEVTDKDRSQDFYKDMGLVYSNLRMVLPRFSEYSDIINNLPKEFRDIFTIDVIYDHIGKLEKIYNETDINELLSLNTEYLLYKDNLDKYEKDELFIEKFESVSQFKSHKKELEKNIGMCDELVEENVHLTNDTIALLNTIEEYKKDLEVLKDTKETVEDYSEVKRECAELAVLDENLTKLNNDLRDYSTEARSVELLIAETYKDLNDKNNKYVEYLSLTKELHKFNKIYHEMDLVKKALSSKEGIPLKKIFNYLGDTEMITNELLDIVYKGAITLDKFEVSPTAFAIPFYTGNTRLPDVKYASQGELSFLSIALSFALSSKTLRKYNIMLLDEIDGPLDKTNRGKFIEVLEHQIDRIDAEQSFLITHNSMFSYYPVDIIDLSFNNKNDEYTLANYVRIDRK